MISEKRLCAIKDILLSHTGLGTETIKDTQIAIQELLDARQKIAEQDALIAELKADGERLAKYADHTMDWDGNGCDYWNCWNDEYCNCGYREARVQHYALKEKVERKCAALPKMSDLIGVAPNITGDMMSEDYVRKLRDESWPKTKED